MSSPADPFSILNRNQGVTTFQKPQSKPKVIRYRAGKAPEFQRGLEEDEEEEYQNEISHYSIESDTASIAETNINLRDEDEELKNRIARRRAVLRTVIVEDTKQVEKDQREIINTPEIRTEKFGQHEEMIVSRKPRKNESLSEQIDENDILLQKICEDVNEEQEEEVINEEKSEEISLLKPVYLKKGERENKNSLVDEEIALKEEQLRLKEKRKQEAKILLIEVKKNLLEKDEEKDESDHEMPNDDDEIDEANEVYFIFYQSTQYEKWKIRELRRIKREREEKIKKEIEREEIERRRKLTDAERIYENKILGADSIKAEKQKYSYMQKYYKIGPFYQDSDDPIYKRDYNVAVGEDLWDKSNLPKVLQVRRGEFGKASRSKYTHLTDQDTTNFDPNWKVHDEIQQKNLFKLGGYKGASQLDRPSNKRN